MPTIRPVYASAASTTSTTNRRTTPSSSAQSARPAPLAHRLARCADLPSLHALLLEEAGRARPPTSDAAASFIPALNAAAVRTLLPAAAAAAAASRTRPADAVAAFQHLAAKWRASPQGPLEAVLLSDALQPAYSLLSLHQSALQPRELAAVITSLASLRSTNPEVLRGLADGLMRRSPPLPRRPPPMAAAAATADVAIAAVPPAAAPPPPAVAAAPGLSQLTSSELAAVVSALAAFNLRPGDAWLGLCMSCLQLELPRLSGPQLAQLLWALVQLGVRPTSPWMVLYEQTLQERLQTDLAAAAAPTAPRRRRPKAGSAGAAAALSCEDLVRVVTAAAEVGFQPGERCRTLLLAAVGGRLGAMQPHQVAGLAWAVTRLGWRPDERWREAFLQVTSSLLPQLRAADLPPVLAFVARANLRPCPVWLRRCLLASRAHLPQVSPRDLPDLLLDLVTIAEEQQLGEGTKLTAASSGGGSASGNHRLRRLFEPLPPPPSPSLRRPKPEAGYYSLRALAASWLRRYLALCAEKLPRFTAAGVARMMAAVARSGARPDERWLQAACAALASKSDVLPPTHVADALTALATLHRQRPAAQGRAAATAARDQRRLLESLLSGVATKLSLLPDDRLVGLTAAVAELLPAATSAATSAATEQRHGHGSGPNCLTAAVGPSPDHRGTGGVALPAAPTGSQPAAWLPALIHRTQLRLEESAAAAAAAATAPATAAAPPTLSPPLLSALVVAVAKLVDGGGAAPPGLPPRRWVAALLAAAGAQMERFDAAALGGLMWGLVVLDVRPPTEWTERLMARVRSCLAGEEGAAKGAEEGAAVGRRYEGAVGRQWERDGDMKAVGWSRVSGSPRGMEVAGGGGAAAAGVTAASGRRAEGLVAVGGLEAQEGGGVGERAVDRSASSGGAAREAEWGRERQGLAGWQKPYGYLTRHAYGGSLPARRALAVSPLPG